MKTVLAILVLGAFLTLTVPVLTAPAPIQPRHRIVLSVHPRRRRTKRRNHYLSWSAR